MALVHYPVKDRRGGAIATAITNLDLHDISRSALTFGVSKTFVVHPVTAQRAMVERLVEHWTTGPGGRRVEDRSRAMAQVRAVASVDDALSSLGAGERAELWVTSAEGRDDQLGQGEACARLRQPGPPVLLALGTGWGLSDAVLERADVKLAPIWGRSGAGDEPGLYNHLSVRAAAAILLDRLTHADPLEHDT